MMLIPHLSCNRVFFKGVRKRGSNPVAQRCHIISLFSGYDPQKLPSPSTPLKESASLRFSLPQVEDGHQAEDLASYHACQQEYQANMFGKAGEEGVWSGFCRFLQNQPSRLYPSQTLPPRYLLGGLELKQYSDSIQKYHATDRFKHTIHRFILGWINKHSYPSEAFQDCGLLFLFSGL